MSWRERKRGLVESCAGQTRLIHEKMLTRFTDLDVGRIRENNFYYNGKINDKKCSFKVDTGSDISVLNKKLINKDMKKIRVRNCNLKYSTGEKILSNFK